MSVQAKHACKPGASSGLSQVTKKGENENCFPFFPKLPMELQLIVWECAMKEPRVVSIANDLHRGKPKLGPFTYINGVLYRQIPEVFFVNSITRKLVIKRYNIHFGVRFATPSNQPLYTIQHPISTRLYTWNCNFMISDDDLVYFPAWKDVHSPIRYNPTLYGQYAKIKNVLVVDYCGPYTYIEATSMSHRNISWQVNHPGVKGPIRALRNALPLTQNNDGLQVEKIYTVRHSIHPMYRSIWLVASQNVTWADIQLCEKLPYGRAVHEDVFGVGSPRVQIAIDVEKLQLSQLRVTQDPDPEKQIIYLLAPKHHTAPWEWEAYDAQGNGSV
ncbi:hypothetical protein F4810DRAFT_726874 [Camillea tinctor]|nr:hypothetical protein F4810DRAFT_726874 [Camillea tinctor]